MSTGFPPGVIPKRFGMITAFCGTFYRHMEFSGIINPMRRIANKAIIGLFLNIIKGSTRFVKSSNIQKNIVPLPCFRGAGRLR